jgi:nucleoid DNA-binding protein
VKTLTKTEIANRLALAAGLSLRQAARIVDLTTGFIAQHLADGGETVTLRGFGTFRLAKRKGFVTSDPRTGKRLVCKPSKFVTFKTSRDLNARIN